MVDCVGGLEAGKSYSPSQILDFVTNLTIEEIRAKTIEIFVEEAVPPFTEIKLNDLWQIIIETYKRSSNKALIAEIIKIRLFINKKIISEKTKLTNK